MSSSPAVVRRLPHSDSDNRRSFAVNLVLASSAMTFGGLVLLYVLLRERAGDWSPPPGRGLAALATAVIALSSLALHAGVRSVLLARPQRLPRWLAATIALGLSFLGLQLFLWRSLSHGGFAIGATAANAFYLLSGFHFVHVVAALLLLLWLVPGALRERYHARNHARVRLVARFWHFLGLNQAVLFYVLFW